MDFATFAGFTVDSDKLEHGCSMSYAGVPSFFHFGLEDGNVPIIQFLPYLEVQG